MLSDPIADFLARVKNGYLAKKKEIIIPHSRLKEELAKILVGEGYLEKLKINPAAGGGKGKMIELTLKYEEKRPALTDIQRISKPGLRIYARKTKIPKVLSGLGGTIVSTPKGLMTGRQAKEKGLGGEVICKVW